jgi:LysM repeat protein
MSDLAARRPITLPVQSTATSICPYLLADDGRWRASTSARDHRCTAVSPATILAPDKQRRLCLTAEHRGCGTYLAGAGLADLDGSRPMRASPDNRPVTRTTPVLLDHRRFAISAPPVLRERGVGQGGMVALMTVAFAAIVVARLSIGGGPDLRPAAGADSSTSPRPAATDVAAQPSAAAPSRTRAPETTPAHTLVPSGVEPTADAPAPPTKAPASDAPAATQRPATYTIRKGDTLSGIAAEYGITWQELAKLNGIDDPGRLRVGQEIRLP